MGGTCGSLRDWWAVTLRGNRALLAGLAREQADKAVERAGRAAQELVRIGVLAERLARRAGRGEGATWKARV